MKFKRFMALAMAGVMTLAMAGSSLAAEDEKVMNDLKFTKEAQFDSNVESIPEEDVVTFKLSNYSAFKIDDKEYASGGELTFDEPTITVKGFTKDQKSIETTIGQKIKDAITKPGVYYLKLDETTEETTGDFGWTSVDEKVYYIVAFAALPETGSDLDVKFVAFEGTDNGPAKTGKADKTTELKFTNTYNKKSGAGDTPSMTLKKTVETGKAYADKDTYYKFTVTFDYPTQAKKVNGLIENAQDKSAEEKSDTTINKEKTTYTVYLQDGKTADFKGLPIGTKVTIKEEDTDSLINWTTANYSGAEDAEKEKNTSTTQFALGETTKNISCANQYKDVTPTGLAISIAPFVAMFAAVGAAIALYVAAKRRVR